MTRSQLRFAIRGMINEPNEANWTDAEINAWINDALNDISVKTRCLLKTYSFNTVASTVEYDLPADFISAERVRYGLTNLLIPITLRELDAQYPNSNWTLITGVPDWYYIKYGSPTYKIGFFKVPSAIITVVLDYTALADPLNDDTTEPEIHPQFQKLIISYCVYKALMKDTRPGEAVNFINEYLIGIEDMKKQLKGNQVDKVYVMTGGGVARKSEAQFPFRYGRYIDWDD